MVERGAGAALTSLRTSRIAGWAERSIGALWPAGVLVVAYAAIDRWVVQTLLLPEAAYQNTFLTWEIATALATSGIGLLGLSGILAVMVLRPRELITSWPDLTTHRGVRALVLAVVAWATWAATTFDYNLFYDQGFNIDRLVLGALTLLVIWRPVFVIPFLFLFEALEHQFDHPFGRQIFSDSILEHLLVLFMAWLIVVAITCRKEATTFVFVGSALLASFYWYPGTVKLERGWLFDGTPYLGGLWRTLMNGLDPGRWKGSTV